MHTIHFFLFVSISFCLFVSSNWENYPRIIPFCSSCFGHLGSMQETSLVVLFCLWNVAVNYSDNGKAACHGTCWPAKGRISLRYIKNHHQESSCSFVVFTWTFLNVSALQWVLLINSKLITMIQQYYHENPTESRNLSLQNIFPLTHSSIFS